MTSSRTCLFHPPGDRLPSFGTLDHYVRHQGQSSGQNSQRPSSSSAIHAGRSSISVSTPRSRIFDESGHPAGSMSPLTSVYSKDNTKHVRRAMPLPAEKRTSTSSRDVAYGNLHTPLFETDRILPSSHPRSLSRPPQRVGRSTTARKCSNCGVSQTRQWVRGDAQSWLCHSCGQFWRKNGYPRPEELWNRPTFRRSSRKRRVNAALEEKKAKASKAGREASSSYMNGKKMVECGERLAPLRRSKPSAANTDSGFSKSEDFDARFHRKGASSSSHVHRKSAGASIASMIHGEPPLPPVSSLLKSSSTGKRANS